jgi:NTP pyrophosphatase (non-canonical NTP hydrolase)
MNISEMAKAIHENAVAKGFYDKPITVGERLMLVVSELGEALEADRTGKYAEPFVFMNMKHSDHPIEYFKEHIKDTFEDELADVAIRLFDLAESKDINLQAHVAAKMAYNNTRERMHGKSY